MNKHQKGLISELFASAYFVKNGYIVSKPITDFNEYDFIVDNGKLNRVQVKTIYFDNSKNRYMISCVTSHIRGNEKRINKKYTKNSFDILCAVEPELGAVYLIPIEAIALRRGVTLYPTGKNNKSNTKYEDFEKYRVC